jgi:uncharacterized short protein YbdD (DUF466 family)
MICRCFGRTLEIPLATWRATAELIVGLPDYDKYTAHAAATHPNEPVMTRDAFFRARQAARFGGGGGLRCC